jgi:NAD(P)-dependent dehydrogenase (short-subunit alcohol dehydrogenase family)
MVTTHSDASVSRPVALVTGAARRLGREIALDLARHGFDVAVHCRQSRTEADSTAAELRALGAQAQVFVTDLSNEADCRALVPAVVAQFKRLDAIVNNASTFEYDAPGSFTYAAMDHHLRANTGPAVLLAQALFDHLKGCAEVGCVVNLVDQKLWNLNPDYFSYTLSKAALEAATVMLAQALAPQVRVCGVAPGLVLESDQINSAALAYLQTQTPLRRGPTAKDIAGAVRYLIQSPAMTGSTLIIDAGSHLTAMPRDFAFARRSHD